MNDPHVNALFYRLITAEDVDYDKAPPLSGDTNDFMYTITRDSAQFTMKSHFATEEEAKKVVDSFLQAWSISIGLDYTPDEIVFRFERSEIIDRCPPRKESKCKSLSASVSETIHVSDSVSGHLSKGRFPPPPNNFTISPDVETMYLRYKAYRQNRESLLSMAYMCLTMIVASAGGKRKDAAKKYYIEFNVLNKLGELTSTRGSESEARKVNKKIAFTPLSQNEKIWIEKVIKRIIIRFGEYAFEDEQKFQTITMNDFPKLDLT